MNPNQLPESLLSKQPVQDLENVFNELGLLLGALEGIADRFHSEEYWHTVGNEKMLITAAIADGLQLKVLIKRFDDLISVGHRFQHDLSRENPSRQRKPTAV